MTFMQKLRKSAKGKKGFTLIELIIVIAIIAILIALIAPNLVKFLGTAKTTASSANAKTAFTSVQTFLTDQYAEGTGITVPADKKITIKGGEAPSVEGLTVESEKTELLTYFTKSELKDITTIVITLSDQTTITDVVLTDANGDTKYPK